MRLQGGNCTGLKRMIWKVKKYTELTTDELYQILRLRSEVFVVEQNCVYQDIDGKDQKALHLSGHVKGQITAYARLFNAGDYFDMPSFGRVLIAMQERGKGYAHILVEKSIEATHQNFGEQPIKVSAQTYLKEFYGKHGFYQQGEEYLEDGIPHISMIRGPK